MQQVYERHAETFEDLQTAENLLPRDQTSIPISYQCSRDDLVRIGDLDIARAEDRVAYYRLLMNEMLRREGRR